MYGTPLICRLDVDPSHGNRPSKGTATLFRYLNYLDQPHYLHLVSVVPDSLIGALSSSMFAGMMIGAVGWGTCSDIIGRSAAFNATLFFTSLFGMLASFSRSFWMLCALQFLLGSAVGVSYSATLTQSDVIAELPGKGSMPTDGTLLLEHMPGDKQYLVTALSVFFSFGSVLSAFVGLLMIPKHSCLPNQPCDISTDNKGWQYMFVSLSLIVCMCLLSVNIAADCFVPDLMHVPCSNTVLPPARISAVPRSCRATPRSIREPPVDLAL